MVDKYHPRLCQSWLWLSLVILTSSLTAEPLMAQVVAPAQIPRGNSTRTTQVPTSPSDVRPEDIQQPPRLEPQQPPRLEPGPEDVQPPSRQPSPELPGTLPPPEDLLRPDGQQPAPAQPPTIPGKVPAQINVTKFEINGSTVFSRQRLEKLLAPYTNKTLTFAQLLQARTAITQLYVDSGYITSGAFIPPQRLSSGVVKIQVIEGGLSEIQVTGTKRLNPNYVRSRIAVANKRPLNRNTLLESLQLLQLNPLIQNLSAELSAGSRPGASLLEVRVSEAKSDNLQLVFDNGRVPSVGTDRRRIQAYDANLLGQGDSLGLTYTNTDGSNAVDLSYAWPLNARNGTLTFSYGNTSSKVIESPFDVLNITSDSRYYEVSFRQPIIQTPSQELALGITAARRESETFLDPEGTPGGKFRFQLSPGADSRGRTRLSELQFFQEWTNRNSRQVLAARSVFTLGIGALDATVNSDPPDSRFFSWRGQAQWVRLLAPDTLLIVRGDVQLADRALVSLEQFSVGGFESVRGYRQDLLLTDNGAIASAEVRIPILRASSVNGLLQLTPFIDFGAGWNNGSDRDNPDPNTLAGIGLGLRWQQGSNLTARFDWGIPLVDVDTRERTWQENGLYFSVQYSPF